MKIWTIAVLCSAAFVKMKVFRYCNIYVEEVVCDLIVCMQVLDRLNRLGTDWGEPLEKVTISDCGIVFPQAK